MARPYRFQGEYCCYHITSRGDGKKDIYKSTTDYLKFLEYVKRGKERYQFYLYAYVLMANHYHLLIETIHANLSRIMQYLNTSYTTYYNVKRKKSGHLFQGRYKSILVEKDTYFLELSRYIHLNPVRAKMVRKPEDHRWSSYRGYIRSKKDEYIDKEQIKEIMNMSGRRYEEFVNAGIGEEINPFKELYAGFILGKVQFIKDKLDELKDQVEGSKEVSYKAQIKGQFAADEIIGIVEKIYGKSIEQLRDSKKENRQAKKMGIYLLRRYTGLNNREIGEKFGMNYSAVSKAGISIEKLMEADKGVRREKKEILSNFEV